MNKKASAIFCLIAAICLLSGCTLAKENSGPEGAAEDRMVGVLVTSEYLDLFNFESYANDNIATLAKGGDININEVNSRKYEGRIYATQSPNDPVTVNPGQSATFVSDNNNFVFEGIDGFRFFAPKVPAQENSEPYHANVFDEGVSDVNVALNFTDEKESISLEGTVFVTPLAGIHTYYFNPVYQDKDGKVYVMSGTGLSGEMNSEGSAFSQNMKSSYTTVENGKKKTEDFSVTVKINVMYAPWKVKLLQMGEDHAVIARDEYPSDSVPDNITPASGTKYIVVENYCKNADGSERVTHDIYDKNDEKLKTYHSLENGICVRRDTTIHWE